MSYDELAAMVIDSESRDWLHDHDVHVLKLDLNVRLAPAREAFRYDEPFDEPWATNFPDRVARVAAYRLWYGSTPVETFYCAAVDGGRAVLPYPKSAQDLSVSPLRYAVGRAVNEDTTGFLDYFARAGLTVG